MEIKDVYVTIHVNQLDEALPFYRELTGKPIEIRWEAPELELEFAVIGIRLGL
ncbi:hypothetical protein SAMN05216378_1501 [Paenibacillus catalpae]|uniref:Glyoxalase/Bleomycin resistance protein/Dioxygenase superfamily protein n=1 Tax=Paenibacillus catalpae TaxID=1045775 RepID=A0A1I1VBM9_9BACL|nr:hypothetical protein SAMN05216378_1501 [Paenibacillus catalpae]